MVPTEESTPAAQSAAPDDEDWREIICRHCGGEGMWESAPWGYSHIDGHLLTNTVVCETCGGSGGVWELCEPIGMEDLDRD